MSSPRVFTRTMYSLKCSLLFVYVHCKVLATVTSVRKTLFLLHRHCADREHVQLKRTVWKVTLAFKSNAIYIGSWATFESVRKWRISIKWLQNIEIKLKRWRKNYYTNISSIWELTELNAISIVTMKYGYFCIIPLIYISALGAYVVFV